MSTCNPVYSHVTTKGHKKIVIVINVLHNVMTFQYLSMSTYMLFIEGNETHTVMCIIVIICNLLFIEASCYDISNQPT